jgi:cellulose synthase/poly-beta-1,6-N-acetylglucosamine synthase-like glycosyltransferase
MIRRLILGTMFVSGGLYAHGVAKAIRGLRRLRPGTNEHEHSFSIIVPARDEEAGIAACIEGLLEQDYPPDLLEIIVVNDRSGDKTREIAERYTTDQRLRVINIESVPDGVSPKKHAVGVGVHAATNEIILTTDADCVHPPTWVRGINTHFAPEIGVVVGHTAYAPPRNTFEGIQAIDYLSHRSLGAGFIGSGEALYSTASNLAYRKQAFDDVGGFGDEISMVSGDDDIFLQRIRRLTNWKITVSATPGTFVQTDPVDSWRTFLRQRARWSSKATHYNADVLPFLAGTFIFLVTLCIAVPAFMISPRKWKCVIPVVLLKGWLDQTILHEGSTILNQRSLMRYFAVADILNPFYNVASILWGLLGRFDWKGRSFSRKVHRSDPSPGTPTGQGGHV